jgi:TRAP-type C4-dicarboxylate transport system substrate-binding protein
MQNPLTGVRACSVLLGVAVVLATGGPAAAIDLRFSIFHTKTDAFSIAEDKWMEAVTKRTDGRIKFKPAYAGSLFTLTEAFDAVQSGAVEVALVAVSVLSGKLPDVSPFEPLGAYSEGPRFAEMMREAEPILDALFAQHKVVYLWSQGAPSVINVCRNKHTKLPEDYKGVKLRAAGRWQAFQMRALGASPIVLDPGSQYQALQTGTIDCALAVNNLALSFKLHEPAKFITQYLMPVNLTIILMNPKVFESLSTEDRKIVREVSRETTMGSMLPMMEAQNAAAAKLKEQGANIYYLTDAERKIFQETSRGVYEEIRKVVGEPGRKLLDLMSRYR